MIPAAANTPAPPKPDQPDDKTAPADNDPVEIASLSFVPSEVSAGNATTLSVQLTGNLSGQTTVSGEISSPSGGANLPFSSTGDGSGGAFGVAITLPAQAESGLWYVKSLVVLNQSSYFLTKSFTAATVPPGGTLRVTSPQADTTPPEVREISLEKVTLRDGEKNRIRIDVADEQSGVASVKGAFQSPSKLATIWFTCGLNSETGIWEGEVLVPAKAECGEWTLQQIRAVDQAKNLTYLSGDSPVLARVSFGVSRDGECDFSPPTLETFDLSPKNVSKETGGEIRVSALVRDVGSGVMSAFGWAAPVAATAQEPKIYFTCAPDPKDPEAPWTGKIVVPQAAAKGTWKVGLVHLEDKARNTSDYQGLDPVIAGATFDVE